MSRQAFYCLVFEHNNFKHYSKLFELSKEDAIKKINQFNESLNKNSGRRAELTDDPIIVRLIEMAEENRRVTKDEIRDIQSTLRDIEERVECLIEN